MFYAYLFVSFCVGVLSNFIRLTWTIVAGTVVVCAGLVINSWPWINVQRDGILKVVYEVLVYGTFSYLGICILFFSVPFILGRLGYQRLLQRRVGSDSE